MKRTIVLVCFLTNFQAAFTQSNYIDSLKEALAKSTQPIERYNLLSEIGNGYYRTGIGDNSVNNYLEMLRIALQQKNDSLIAASYNKIGDFYAFEKGDFYTGIDYFFKEYRMQTKQKVGDGYPHYILTLAFVTIVCKTHKQEMIF